jgi:UDP-glucose 4-epimerase
MKVLVTGSSGHLGEALVGALKADGFEVVGLDLVASNGTDVVGSITDRSLVQRSLFEVDAVIHAATLHKPHIGTHTNQDFVETNVTGTLNLLEEALAAGIGCFVLTSSTSVFGRALVRPVGEPATWITEDVVPVPKNIYGVTKKAAEDLCELFHLNHDLPCVILRTSRFFPEQDDNPELRDNYEDANIKVNELLYRRVDLADVVSAHLLALRRARSIGFGRYIISSTTPFTGRELAELRVDAPSVVQRLFPKCKEIYDSRGWRVFPSIDRVYVNQRARSDLGWTPEYDFQHALARLRANEDPRSTTAISVRAKGYQGTSTYPYAPS